MIVIALLILPFLALEVYWKEQLPNHPGMKLFLDIGASVIWLAFAIEFILMLSVAPHKGRHCVQNWMDLAVVLLPLIEFLPLLRLLRLTRLMQLQQLSRMGRVYRLRGLLFKLWRAVLVLEMVQRLLRINPQKRLARLKELLAAKNEEIEDIKKEIDELEKRMLESRERA
jgi:voltage-gated potassium channel